MILGDMWSLGLREAVSCDEPYSTHVSYKNTTDDYHNNTPLSSIAIRGVGLSADHLVD
jgi:hypothetical protein